MPNSSFPRNPNARDPVQRSMKLKLNNSLEGVAKLVGIVLLAIVGLWMAGVLLRGLGALVLGIVGLIAALLKFLLVAALVIGVGYLVGKALLERRKTLNSPTSKNGPVDAQTAYISAEPTEPRPSSPRLD